MSASDWKTIVVPGREAELARETSRRTGSSPLGELAWLFLRLGATAFGGPAVHIAMMEDEVVRRRGWLTRQEFLDLLGVTNMIPGPNSTEMAIHIGWHRARWAGLVVAGACFILPATLIVTALAWAYVRFGTRPEAEALLYGIKPVIIAVVLQAIARLAPTALSSVSLATIAGLIGVLSLLGVDELMLLAGGALASVILRRGHEHPRPPPSGRMMGLGLLAAAPVGGSALASAATAPAGLIPIFLFFLKVGSVLFGSGYVLLAFLRSDLVERFGWLTEAELLDAVAVGQVTPGPVFTTATFIGYVVAGFPGAAVATVGIFLPAFCFVAAIGPLVPRLRRSPAVGTVLDGLNAASLALMAVVTLQLGWAAIVDVPTLLLAAAGAIVLLRYRINSTWLILAGATSGVLVTRLGLR